MLSGALGYAGLVWFTRLGKLTNAQSCHCNDRSNPDPRLLMMVLHQQYLIVGHVLLGQVRYDNMYIYTFSTSYYIYMYSHRWYFINVYGTIHGYLMLTAYWFTDNWLARGGCDWRRVSGGLVCGRLKIFG